jgi:gamma-glutamyltranspeptidase/glutathione hydrolase
MRFDPLYQPHASMRNPVYAAGGVVATSHPAAADIGLDVLKNGGNAVDAAVAAAAALAVLEPTSNGLGSDCFALIHDGTKLHGLNASGWSPQALSADALAAAGKTEISPFGWDAVTVPGAIAGWGELSRRFGSMDAAALLGGLIRRFRHGIPVPPTVAANWQRALEAYRLRLAGDDGRIPGHFRHWFDHFAPDGHTPASGERWSSEDQIRTLEILSSEGFDSFYRGTLAEELLAFSRETGGYFSAEDLAQYQPEWVDPISIDYKGYKIWEIPPNGQGITALMALGMLSQDDLAAPDFPADIHLGIEAIKLAFADTQTYVSDPAWMSRSAADLLDRNYLRSRRDLIGSEALDPSPGTPPRGGTVYLATADANGMMVSFIQSNYMGFGSGLVVPGTGISLQNRGHNFTLEVGHENRMEGRKRPYHTIIPGFLTQGERALGPFGVMGGFMQPQGHLQVVQNLIDYHLNPQAALDAPRWQWLEGRRVILEADFHPSLAAELGRRGHRVAIETNYGHFGRGQIILRGENGVFCAGTEKRCDGYIAAY